MQFSFRVLDGLFVLEEGEDCCGQRLGKAGQEGDGLEVEALGLEQGDAFELFQLMRTRRCNGRRFWRFGSSPVRRAIIR